MHAHYTLSGLLEYHHFGSFLVVRHVRNYVPQREETQFELIPPLPLEHVMSPPFIVILRVRCPGTRAFSVVANLFKRPNVTLEFNPLDCRLLVLRGWGGCVVVLVNINVTPLEDDGALMRCVGVRLPHRLSLLHRDNVDFLLLFVICLDLKSKKNTLICLFILDNLA